MTTKILDVLRALAAMPCDVPTPWPYLDRLVPAGDTGGTDPQTCSTERSGEGTVVTVYAAACDGLRRLAEPGAWSICKVGVTAGALQQRLHWMGRDAYGAGYRTANGRIVAEHGFEEWLAQRLDLPAPVPLGSCVTAVGRGLQVRLPGSLSVRCFDRALSDALEAIALDRVMTSPTGAARCAAFSLDADRYCRVTSYDFAGRLRVSRAREVMFFRPRLDVAALVRVIEAVVAEHLAMVTNAVRRAA